MKRLLWLIPAILALSNAVVAGSGGDDLPLKGFAPGQADTASFVVTLVVAFAAYLIVGLIRANANTTAEKTVDYIIKHVGKILRAKSLETAEKPPAQKSPKEKEEELKDRLGSDKYAALLNYRITRFNQARRVIITLGGFVFLDWVFGISTVDGFLWEGLRKVTTTGEYWLMICLVQFYSFITFLSYLRALDTAINHPPFCGWTLKLSTSAFLDKYSVTFFALLPVFPAIQLSFFDS